MVEVDDACAYSHCIMLNVNLNHNNGNLSHIKFKCGCP